MIKKLGIPIIEFGDEVVDEFGKSWSRSKNTSPLINPCFVDISKSGNPTKSVLNPLNGINKNIYI